MRWYVNDLSLQGQFPDGETIEQILQDLVSMRASIQVVRVNLRTTRSFPQRCVCNDVTLRIYLSRSANTDLRRAVLNWLDRSGPFVEDDRLPENDDYFEFEELDVSDTGLGEAARRVKSGEASSCFSFAGGVTDFTRSPLTVHHGLAGERLGVFDVANYWRTLDLRQAALQARMPATSWRELVETAREDFPLLLLPDSLYLNEAIAREPFDAVIRDRATELFRHLQSYMAGRDPDGVEGPRARTVIDNFFVGERALFTGESPSNRRVFRAELTFRDPQAPDRTIFAHWHGKISHRHFRLHFEWPVPPQVARLRVLYLGPKLTKK